MSGRTSCRVFIVGEVSCSRGGGSSGEGDGNNETPSFLFSVEDYIKPLHVNQMLHVNECSN